MQSFKFLFLPVILLMGMSMIASATPVTCSNQQVVVGLTCTLGDLTFNFEAVNFLGTNSAWDSLGIETPPTSTATPGDVVLGFQVLATYPVDIHLDYSVTSTSADIVAIDSTFGPPAPAGSQIFETACPQDPTTIPPGCGTPYATVTNTTGAYTVSPTFGPVSQIYIDKDVTDFGFSSFTDSVEESAVPEPASFWFLGPALFGLAILSRKFRTQ